MKAVRISIFEIKSVNYEYGARTEDLPNNKVFINPIEANK